MKWIECKQGHAMRFGASFVLPGEGFAKVEDDQLEALREFGVFVSLEDEDMVTVHDTAPDAPDAVVEDDTDMLVDTSKLGKKK